MKKIFLVALFFATGNIGAFAQSNQAQVNSSGQGVKPAPRPLDEHAKAIFADKISRWQKQIDSCAPKNCDDSDRLVLLTRILINDRLLARGNDAVTTMTRIRTLLKSHPGLIHNGHLPNQTQAELAEQKEQERKREALAKKNFIPSDVHCFDVMGEGRDAVFLYQYHLEFYHLPKDMSLGDSRNIPQPPYGVCDRIIPQYGWKPFKTVTFKHRIEVPSEERWKSVKFIWVCHDELEGDYYSGSTHEERVILRQKYPRNWIMPWVNPSADYGYFCGAISLDGKTVYQLPIKQHPPDTLFQFGAMGNDGKSLEIKIGKLMTGEGEDGPETFVGDFRKFLIWTYPDHIQVFDKKNMSDLLAALKKAGLTGR